MGELGNKFHQTTIKIETLKKTTAKEVNKCSLSKGLCRASDFGSATALNVVAML